MGMGVCLTCGQEASLELHHVAGRHNVADLVVAVCGACHLVLTNWQHAAGIELGEHVPRHPSDMHRALCVGVTHLFQLVEQRSLAPTAPDELWRLAARAMSRVLDLDAPADRAGRWLPDPTVDPHRAEPIVIDAERAKVQQHESLYLIRDLLRLLGDTPPLTPEVMEQILADPTSMPDRLATVDARDHAGPSLPILIEQHLQAASRIMRWLPSVEDWSLVAEIDMHELLTWIDSGKQILTKIARAATLDSPDAA
jgi:hypothetical protein